MKVCGKLLRENKSEISMYFFSHNKFIVPVRIERINLVYMWVELVLGFGNCQTYFWGINPLILMHIIHNLYWEDYQLMSNLN